jgi:hypothetical protein
VLSVGFLRAELDDELLAVLGGVQRWCWDKYGLEPHVFEHGAKSFREKGGACADHAHVQVAPVGVSNLFVSALTTQFTTADATGYPGCARDLIRDGDGSPYLYTYSETGGAAIALANGARSQFFRRLLAEQAGRPDEWDGPMFPHLDNIRRTLVDGRDLPKYMV